jgi:hypothetical protein
MKKQATFTTDELLDIQRTQKTDTQTHIHITDSHTALLNTCHISYATKKCSLYEKFQCILFTNVYKLSVILQEHRILNLQIQYSWQLYFNSLWWHQYWKNVTLDHLDSTHVTHSKQRLNKPGERKQLLITFPSNISCSLFQMYYRITLYEIN